MYDYFNGKIASLDPTAVTIECGGVGYHLQISLHTYGQLKDKSTFRLFAHHVVREDAQLLFGFAEEGERYMFRELLNVSGVGASTARIVLSSMTAGQLRNVIASGDIISLQKVKGIGAKTAQRIVVDLQDKMKKGQQEVIINSSGGHNTESNEALSALLTLGFARVNAEKAILQASKSLGSDSKVEDIIKVALSYL
ncbi:MAG: Holliday junction branch migration protein RuvA [Bacteroidetes bacterium]|jgi:Holliday junction DNA helicase RuvA|nr:Holliday junction branch migration protein RuvA [Bacteroidota bacterium]